MRGAITNEPAQSSGLQKNASALHFGNGISVGWPAYRISSAGGERGFADMLNRAGAITLLNPDGTLIQNLQPRDGKIGVRLGWHCHALGCAFLTSRRKLTRQTRKSTQSHPRMKS